MRPPQVLRGDRIRVGSAGLNGLVLDIYKDGSLSVGYYQNELIAIKDDVTWNGGYWQFVNSGPSGSHLHGAEEAMVKRGPRFWAICSLVQD